jgi:hypothetical protein
VKRVLIAVGVVIAVVVAIGAMGAYRTPAPDICDVVENWRVRLKRLG